MMISAKIKRIAGLLSVLLLMAAYSHAQTGSATHTVITYNVENMFDADGVARFDDYRPADDQGNPLYTKEDVLTKIQNAVEVIGQYNKGNGPDILILEELESDFTHTEGEERLSLAEFNERYGDTRLQYMLGEEFDEQVKDLPSELLLYKGLQDAGMDNYEVAVGYNRKNDDGEPEHAHKNVVFSRLPVDTSKTNIHYIPNARPILEVWVSSGSADDSLVVFANHWKSGASSWDTEKTRIKNARVLQERTSELLQANPDLDIILGGDFNSDYNQKYRYEMPRTGINTVLSTTGDELAVATGEYRGFYNLWYELPVDQRYSDAYRGKWGTLMHLMVSHGLYDSLGYQYVDGSFEVGQFDGLNSYKNSGQPKRWSSVGEGYGYSDHFPLSMEVKLIPDRKESESTIALENPGEVDNDKWSPIPVEFNFPPQNALTGDDIEGMSLKGNYAYYGRYFKLVAEVTQDYNVLVKNEEFDIYTPGFDFESELEKNNVEPGQTFHFYGRLSRYRGTWQFIIEDPRYIGIKP